MNVDLILNIIREKNSFLSKIIDHVKIEYIDDFKARFSGVSDTIAFFDAVNFIVYYGDGLCKDYSVDEQAFIIAHEIMHYWVSINVNRKQFHSLRKQRNRPPYSPPSCYGHPAPSGQTDNRF